MTAQPFGQYDLLKRIGVGGMGELLLARHRGIEGFEKLLVIKRIVPERSRDQSFVRMFLNEARLAATLNHPNIVQIYDLGLADGRYFIAMEYVNGVDLGRIVSREARSGGFVPLEHALKILCYVCEALTYAHCKTDAQGKPLRLIHRDVTSENVLVSFDGGVKLTDFGIAKIEGGEQTEIGKVKGKHNYLSPEQILGRPVDQRSDLFSMGILLYRLVTGELPFARESDLETMEAILSRTPRGLEAVRATCPAGLPVLIEKALAKSPSDRFQDALSLQMALERLLADLGAVSNAHLIGQYVRGLFQDVIEAQTSFSQDQRTVTLAGILSGLELSGLETSDLDRLEPSLVGGTESVPVEISVLLPGSSRDLDLPFVTTDVWLRNKIRGCLTRHWRWLAPAAAVLVVIVLGLVLRDRTPESRSTIPGVPAAERVPAGSPHRVPAEPVVPASGSEPPAPVVVPPRQAASEKSTRSAGHARPRIRPTPNAPVPKRPDPGVPAPAPEGFGLLTLDSKPWAEVWLEGTRIGVTPLADRKLPAGRRMLVLKNPKLGLSKTLWVQIEPDLSVVFDVRLDQL